MASGLPSDHAFGTRLKRYREAAGLTQEDLAGRAGMSVRGLVYLEHGQRQPYPHTVRRLADALELAATERASFVTTVHPEGVSRTTLVRDPTQALANLPPLVGRQPELGVVGALLDDSLAQGRGAVLGLEGDAGIGKTRLAQEILRSGWRRGWHVLFGSTHEQEGQMPYLPFVEALRQALWIDPAGAEMIPAELAIAIPELPPTAAAVSIPDRLAAQSALFAGVSRFLAARACSAPVVLILDDLHAVDAGSLKLFHYLARETLTLPLLLVGSWRSHEPAAPPELADLISSLERKKILHRLLLRPLPQGEHRALLEQVLEGGSVDLHLASELYRVSEGNALFAGDIVRHLAAAGVIVRTDGTWHFATSSGVVPPLPGAMIPPSLQELSRRRVAALSPAARQLVQLAATVGGNVPVAVLDHGMPPGAAGAAPLDVTDEAMNAGLLTEAGDTVQFSHPLLCEAIYGQMSHIRRRGLHGVVAGVLEALHTDTPDALPVEAVALHHRLAGNIGRAIHYLLRAGDRAEGVYDHDGALRRYGEALAMLNQGTVSDQACLLAEVWERIGDAYRAIGDVARGLEAYRQALGSIGGAETSVDQQHRFALHRKIALGAILTMDMPVAAAHLEYARALVGADPVDDARLLIAAALFAWHAMEFDTAIAHASRAREIAARAGARVEISQAYELLALAYLPLGNWEEGLRCELHRHTSDWSPDVMVAIDAHLCLYQYKLHSAESLRQAQRFIEEVAQQAATVGNQRCLAVCHFVLGHLALRQGLPDAAAENLAMALTLNERIGSPAGVAYTLARQVELLTAVERHAPVPRLLERGIEAAHRAAVRDHCLGQVYTAGIRNRLAAGDEASATALVKSAMAHDAAGRPCAVCRVDLYDVLATYYLARGEPEPALSYIAQALRLADQAQNRAGRARLLRTWGQVHITRGATGEAERCLREAIDIFRESDDLYDLARTLQVLVELGSARESANLLREAEAILAPYQVASLAAIVGA